VVTVSDRSGKALFERSASGEDSTHGWSYNPKNCNQVLSHSMVKLFSSLLADRDFIQAMSVPPVGKASTTP